MVVTDRDQTEAEKAQYAKFHRKVTELGSLISELVGYASAWHALRIDDENTIRALNRSRGFFVPTLGALKGMTLLQLAKVFDGHRETVSLNNLLKEAKGNRMVLTPYASEQDLLDIEKQIGAKAAELKSLKFLRDKRIAHHDELLPDSDPLLYGQVRQLVEDAKSIYNAIQKGHDDTSTSFEQKSKDTERHCDHVVGLVCEEMARAAHRLEEVMRDIVVKMHSEGQEPDEIARQLRLDLSKVEYFLRTLGAPNQAP